MLLHMLLQSKPKKIIVAAIIWTRSLLPIRLVAQTFLDQVHYQFATVADEFWEGLKGVVADLHGV